MAGEFCAYLFDSLWNWAGWMMIGLGIIQLAEFLSNKRIPLFSWKVKLAMAFVVFQWAQFNAYKFKSDELAQLQQQRPEARCRSRFQKNEFSLAAKSFRPE